MCGVIGIIDRKKPVFERAFLGIKSLQNRGEDACGIATESRGEVFLKKDIDSPDKVFKSVDSKTLKGSLAVCHNRYATQGRETVCDAQPICTTESPKIAFALNGNAVNYFSLKKKMLRKGVNLKTAVDTEIMLNIFAGEYRRNQDFFLAARKLMRQVRGGYSAVGLIAGMGLFGIRDPHGIRPLVLGKKAGSYMLSSETNALDKLGYKFIREIKPGEALIITKDMKSKSKVLKKRRKAACMFESVYFSNEESRIGKRKVSSLRREIGSRIAKKIRKGEVDIIVPVPDTGKPSARQISRELEVPYVEALEKNRKIKRTFILPSHKIRSDAVKSKFALKGSAVAGKKVGLVDDSLVRGTTAKMLVKMLRDAGASSIVFISACPKVKFPCFYGINMSTRRELIGSGRGTRSVQKLIGADRLVYLPLRYLKRTLGKEICTACLTKVYPVRISLRERMTLAHQRAMQDRHYTTRYTAVMLRLQKLHQKLDGIKRKGKDTLLKLDEKIPYISFLYYLVKKRK